MFTSDVFTEFHIGSTAHAIVLIVIGFIVARLLSVSFNKALKRRLTAQQAMLLRRVTFYVVFLLFLASAIQQLGFHISALLGATGILTVAIGIASQTSMSNIISGIFIIGEKPFEIGDTIKVNEIQGEVIAIDYLSVKLRTSENTMVRVPNETLIKSNVNNLSYFPIRRADLTLSVSYKSDLDFVKKILLEVATKNEYCLAEPKPSFLIASFGDSAINLQFFAWSTNANHQELKNTLQTEIKQAFTKHQIEIPSLTHSLYIGNDTEPLPIKIIVENKTE